jgi:hypothetical protein
METEMKTVGECLRNNWNSLNDAEGAEKKLRIDIQNNFSCNGKFDLEFYMKNLWRRQKNNGNN